MCFLERKGRLRSVFVALFEVLHLLKPTWTALSVDLGGHIDLVFCPAVEPWTYRKQIMSTSVKPLITWYPWLPLSFEEKSMIWDRSNGPSFNFVEHSQHYETKENRIQHFKVQIMIQHMHSSPRLPVMLSTCWTGTDQKRLRGERANKWERERVRVSCERRKRTFGWI